VIPETDAPVDSVCRPNYLLIAAQALALGLPLVTANTGSSGACRSYSLRIGFRPEPRSSCATVEVVTALVRSAERLDGRDADPRGTIDVEVTT